MPCAPKTPGQQQQQAQPTVEAQQQPVEQQPQAQEQPQAGDDEISRLLQQNPKLLSAMSDLQQHWEGQTRAAQDYYNRALANNAQVLVSHIATRNPELRGIPVEQWPVVLQSLNASNPQRASQLLGELEGTRSYFNEMQQNHVAYQQQQAARARQQFEREAAIADDAFERFAASQVSPQELNEIKLEARNMLRESGISEPELNQRWQTDPTLRSYQAQTLLFEAARGRVARRANAEMQKSIREKAVRPVPIIQRPGSPTEIESRENFDMRKMSKRLDRSTGKGANKAAARLVAARRRSR